MTEAQRRVMHARQNAENKILNPLKEVIDAFGALALEQAMEIKAQQEELARLKANVGTHPVANAPLSELWHLLGVDNQQQARLKVRLLRYQAGELNHVQESLSALFEQLEVKTYADAVETISQMK